MARARNIKPGFYKNDELAECSVWARLIFPGLWMLADREGRLKDRPKRIKGELLPFDEQAIEPLLVELEAAGFLIRYKNESGAFIQICKFSAHQKPHYSETASTIKPPPNWEDPPSDVHDEGGIPENSGKHHALRGGRNALNPSSLNPSSLNPSSLNPSSLNPSSLNPSSLNPECGASAPDPGGQPKAHTLPKEYQEVIDSLRPELDAAMVYGKFCGHKPASQRTLVTWRQWVVDERSPATAPARVADPDSRASVEAVGMSIGVGKWDELAEPWHAYKARVKARVGGVPA